MKRATFISALLVLTPLMTSCGSGGGGSEEMTGDPQESEMRPVDDLTLWDSSMESFGRTHCNYLTQGKDAFDPLLAATYYDADWVFRQIARHTGDASWLDCAAAAREIYRDRYLLRNNGRLPGFWLFPHGLKGSAIEDGDEASREALLLLSREGAFVGEATRLELAASTDQSREVAYAIMTLIGAEQVGALRTARTEALVNLALDHLDQWFVKRSAPYVRPFMVGLTSQALIEWHEQTGDPRVLPALSRAADTLWRTCWREEAGAFQYTDRNVPSGGTEAAPDLNLLIAPLYAWLYRQTGDPRWGTSGDKIFRGGTQSAFLGNPKQFNQNYRWSFDFVKWRYGGR